MEATKYRNGPAVLVTPEAVTPEGLVPMPPHSIPLSVDDATPETFLFVEQVPLGRYFEHTPIKKDAPLAPVFLVRSPGLTSWMPHQWEVIRCPYCGKRHWHNIPPDDRPPHGDPRTALGGRVAHCCSDEYRLILIETSDDTSEPSREELDFYFPRVQRVESIARSGFSSELRNHVWAMTNGVCWYCGIQMQPFTTYTIDHVHPVAKGGTNDLDNLVPCCKSCNSTKGDRSLHYLRSRLGITAFWFEKNGGAT